MAGKGSPKGVRQGGRQKGTPNKATAAKAREIEQSGLTPLAYMLEVLRDEALDREARMDAAKAAAPYVHPKLAQVEHGNKNGIPFLVTMSDADLEL